MRFGLLFVILLLALVQSHSTRVYVKRTKYFGHAPVDTTDNSVSPQQYYKPPAGPKAVTPLKKVLPKEPWEKYAEVRNASLPTLDIKDREKRGDDPEGDVTRKQKAADIIAAAQAPLPPPPKFYRLVHPVMHDPICTDSPAECLKKLRENDHTQQLWTDAKKEMDKEAKQHMTPDGMVIARELAEAEPCPIDPDTGKCVKDKPKAHVVPKYHSGFTTQCGGPKNPCPVLVPCGLKDGGPCHEAAPPCGPGYYKTCGDV